MRFRRWICALIAAAILATAGLAHAFADAADPGAGYDDTGDIIGQAPDAPVGLETDYGDTGLTLDTDDDGPADPATGTTVDTDDTDDPDADAGDADVDANPADDAQDAPLLSDDTGLEDTGLTPENDDGSPMEVLSPDQLEPTVQMVYPQGGMSEEDAIAGYIMQQFNDATAGRATRLRTAANIGGRFGDTPTGRLYDKLRPLVKQVADGNLASTVFKIPIKDIYSKETYTAAELGVSSIYEDGMPSWKAYFAFLEKVSVDFAAVLDALMADCPYDMYWYDKTSTGGSSSTSVACAFDTNVVRIRDYSTGTLTYSMGVSANYSATGNTGTFDVNTTKAKAVQSAATNAGSIVSKYAGSGYSDLERLRGYKDEICALVSYNYDAAYSSTMNYGDPWQLVWVFDGNTTTNVVCEGYAKAFQFLCDRTKFSSNVGALSVTGYMTSNANSQGGLHMWNIVSYGGANYLVDVTNCDEGMSGYPDRLFMKGYSYANTDTWGSTYYFTLPSKTIHYTYDSYTQRTYLDSDLALSDNPVGPGSATSTVGSLTWSMNGDGALYISGNGPIPDFTASNPAPWDASKLTSVTISGGVTAIGQRAFYNCTKLTQVTVPASIQSIADNAFEGCTGMIGSSSNGLIIASCKSPAATWATNHTINHSVKHGATVTDWAVEPTCTKTGLTQGCHCADCGFVAVKQEVVKAKGHTPKTDAAVAATCTTAGYTEGSHCAVCGATIKARTKVAAKGHSYGAWKVTRAATCTAKGSQTHTCTACGHTETQDIPATGHKATTVKGYAATCTKAGLTDGSKCATCGVTLTAQKTIPATGHKATTVTGYAATCTKAGLSDGSKCSVCGTWITPQKAIPATGHKAVTVKGSAATCTKAGLTDGSKCSVCGTWITPQKAIPATGHKPVTDYGYAATCTTSGLTNGSHCSVCGATLSARQYIAPTGHYAVTDYGYAPTYTSPGLTDGSHCAYCGVVFVGQQYIPMLEYPTRVLDRKKNNGVLTMNIGDKVRLIPQFAYDAGVSVTGLKSNKVKFATVEGDGLVTAHAEGKVKITVTTSNRKIKATITVQVINPYKPTGISIAQGKAVTLRVGESIQLFPNLAPASAQSALTWTSNKSKVAYVDGNGYVTALKKGKAKITVKTYNKKKATITVNVVP